MTDDEIRKRMELAAARQRSWQRTRANQQQVEPQQPQGAGRAGGLKGFALDVLPFGRVAEKTINPNAGQVTGGELLSEAALTLLPFGLGRIGKGIKAGKAALGAAKGARTATQSPNAAQILATPSTVSKSSGPVSRTAERLFGTQTGIRPGAKVGSQTLESGRAKELQEHVRKNIGSRPSDAADTILRRNEAFMQNKRTDLNNILEAKNTPLRQGEAQSILKGMKNPVGVDAANNSTYKALVNDAADIKDLKGLEQYRRDIDEIINFSRSAASPDPAAERIALNARRAIDGYMGKKVPELKPIKAELSKAYDTKTFIEPAAARPGGGGGPRPLGIPIPGAARVGQSLAGIGARGAEILSGGAKATGSTPGIGRTAAKIGAQQGGVRLGAQALGMRDQGVIPEAAPVDMSVAPSTEQTMGADVLSGLGAEPQIDEAQQRMQMFMQGAERAAMAGDFEASQELMGMAEQLSAISEAQTPEEPEADKKTGAAITTLNQVEQLFNQAGGGQGLLGFGAKLAGAARMNPEVEAYDRVRKSAAVQLARAFGEVGALSNQDIDMYAKMLPDSTSTPEAAAIQFNSLRERLGAGAASGSGEASNILSRLGY